MRLEYQRPGVRQFVVYEEIDAIAQEKATVGPFLWGFLVEQVCMFGQVLLDMVHVRLDSSVGKFLSDIGQQCMGQCG